MYVDVLRRLRDVVRRKHPEKWKTSRWFLLHDNAPAHRSVFFRDFLAKNTVTTMEFPHTLLTCSSWFLSVPSTEISVEAPAPLWCNWHHQECDGRAENAVTKCLPGMFPTFLQSLSEVHIGIRRLFWRKYSTVLYFSDIQWFQKHFEATTFFTSYNCEELRNILNCLYTRPVEFHCFLNRKLDFFSFLHMTLYPMMTDKCKWMYNIICSGQHNSAVIGRVGEGQVVHLYDMKECGVVEDSARSYPR